MLDFRLEDLRFFFLTLEASTAGDALIVNELLFLIFQVFKTGFVAIELSFALISELFETALTTVFLAKGTATGFTFAGGAKSRSLQNKIYNKIAIEKSPKAKIFTLAM